MVESYTNDVSRLNVSVRWTQQGPPISYRYDSITARFDLQRVNPADPTAIPVSSPTFVPTAVTLPPAAFKPGDKVKLRGGAMSRSMSSSECLGARGSGSLGLVVKVKNHGGAGSGGSGGGASGGGKSGSGSGFSDAMVTVAGMSSGFVESFDSTDLVYADDSPQGAHRSILAPGASSSAVTTTTQSFFVGDRVRLHPSYIVSKSSTNTFALGKSSSDNIVGIVDAVGNGKALVKNCVGTNGGSSAYLFSELVMDGSKKPVSSTQTTFQIGDRVVLTDSYFGQHSQGWCLGSRSENVVGVVTFAPPHNSSEEQRMVMVSALTQSTLSLGNRLKSSETIDLSSSYLFRASWLQRVVLPCASPSATSANTLSSPIHVDAYFKIGERVQLNPAGWVDGADVTEGKNLGKPGQGASHEQLILCFLLFVNQVIMASFLMWVMFEMESSEM